MSDEPPTPEEMARWRQWAQERALRRPMKSQGGAEEFHARQIRKAIRDAEADGYVVEFDWKGWLAPSTVGIGIVHKDGRWNERVRVWPQE